MKNVHGIVYAYHGFTELGELGTHRTGASMPFCCRYRLIDFALSAMMNAGIRSVGVIMQRGYQSLMDHLGSGRTWDMGSRLDGFRMLPPYALPDSHNGVYAGCMEALSAVSSYIGEIKQEYVLLTRGDLFANIDFSAVIEQHLSSGADITAVCTDYVPRGIHHRFIPGEDGFAAEILCRQYNGSRGVSSLETYVMRRDRLLELIDWCAEGNRLHFHRDALTHAMSHGVRVGIYLHKGYARHIMSVADYYDANMDMLDREKRGQIFLEGRRIVTRERSDVSTYYGDTALVKNSLIADGCIVEGSVENCILFCGVKVAAGSVLKNCIIMNDTEIGHDTELSCIISDKNVSISPFVTLMGNSRLPIVIPKMSKI